MIAVILYEFMKIPTLQMTLKPPPKLLTPAQRMVQLQPLTPLLTTSMTLESAVSAVMTQRIQMLILTTGI